jgi:hypothetical protein
MIDFTDDKDLNSELNSYLESITANEAKELTEQESRFIQRTLQDMIPLVPVANSAYYTDLIFISYMDVKMGRIARKEELSQKDIDVISRWKNNRANTLKVMGLDAKSLKAQKKGNLGEFIDEIVENSPHFKKANEIGSIEAARKLMNPIANSNEIPTGHKNKFYRQDPAKVLKFLETASEK